MNTIPDTIMPQPSESKAARRWALGIALLAISASLYLLLPTVADPDLWGHVRFGHDLWATGDLYRADTYSYLSGEQPWINHEWLAELIFYGAYAAGGSAGLVALKAGISLLIVALVYRRLSTAAQRPAMAALLTVLVAALLKPGLGTMRPHAFTYLGLLLLLLILDRADGGDVRRLWAAPPLLAVWTNLHGGFLAGVGVLVLWLAARLVLNLASRRLPSVPRQPLPWSAVAAVAASTLATLANPYGAGLWRFLLRTATVPRPEITEWQPLNLISAYGGLYLALLAVSLVGLARSRRQRSPALLAVFVCLAAMPLAAVRHTMLFALGAAVLMGDHVHDAFERQWPVRVRPTQARAGRVAKAVAALCCVGALAFLTATWPKVRCVGLPKGMYPVRAVALLRASDVQGNLAVFFNWGEYAIWHLGPQVKVSMDGRRETVYTDEARALDNDMLAGVRDWDALLDDHPTDMVLATKGWPVYNLMTLKPGWVMLYEDDLCALFAREGSPQAAQLRATGVPDVPYDGEGMCFR